MTEPVTGTRIVVCLKWVPTRAEVDPITGTVEVDERFSGISPADTAALEWALRLAGEGGSVEAVTAGPPAADQALRTALAVGASAAVRIDWPEASEADSRAVAQALARVARGAALVLCGDHSPDRGSGSVPAFLAHELGYGQALGCLHIDLPDGGVGPDGPRPIVTRRLDQGRRERLQLTGPTVVSVEGGLELRRASLGATMASLDADLTVQATASIGPRPRAPVVDTGPYRPRPRVLPAPTGTTFERIGALTGAGEDRPAAQHLELEPEDAADAVVDALTRWGYLPRDR